MIYTKTFTAGGDIAPHRIVRMDGASLSVFEADTHDRIIGVYIGPAAAVVGDTVEICLLGECNVEVSGTVNRGRFVTATTDGKGIQPTPAAGTNSQVIGWALSTATSTVVPCFIVPGWMQG